MTSHARPRSFIPYRVAKTLICILVILVSVFFLSPKFSSPRTWKNEISSIDKYVATTATLSLTSAAISVAITLLPQDVGDPLAQEVVEMNNALLIIICLLFLEKFMLTVMGYIAFTWMIPIAMLVSVYAVWRKSEKAKQTSLKLCVCALILLLIVPSGIHISQIIERTHSEDIQRIMEEAESAGTESNELVALSNAADEESVSSDDLTSTIAPDLETASSIEPEETASVETAQESTGFWGGIVKGASSVKDTVVGGAVSAKDSIVSAKDSVVTASSNAINSIANSTSDLVKKFKGVLQCLLSAIAVTIITSCIIPILIWIAFIVVMRAFWQIELPTFSGLLNALNQKRKPKPLNAGTAYDSERE